MDSYRRNILKNPFLKLIQNYYKTTQNTVRGYAVMKKKEDLELMPAISSMINSLTKTEKKIAEKILKDPEQIVYSSITDLAENVGVGDATIIRFCRKFNCKGYHEFKMKLAQEIWGNTNQSTTGLEREIGVDDEVSVVIKKIYNSNLKALQETISLLNEEDISEAVDIMDNSNKVHFYGIGASAIIAMDAKYKYSRIGLDVDVFIDGHAMFMDAALLTDKDTVVGISYSGSTKDTVDALRIAKKTGAKTICITHHMKSPITQYADIVLVTGSRETPFQGGALSTKIAQMFMLDILYTEVFKKNTELYSRNKKKTSEVLVEKLY